MHALEDVTVADFTQLMAGGWAAQKLGDMGADVIKIEPPHGEPQRNMTYRGQYLDGEGIGYLAMNRSKRNVVIDLKTEEGFEAAKSIVAEADVLTHNFRPGTMEKLGFTYTDVTEYNPDIVYLQVSAYGSDGPYAGRPGQDLIYQALTGLTSYTGRAGEPPTPAGTVVVDEHTATLAALHTLEALYHRERTGGGQKVEASLFNSAIDLQCNELTYAMNFGEDLPRGRKTHGHPYLYPPYGVYEAADGYVAIGMAPMESIAEVFDLPPLAEYESQAELFENRDEIHDLIETYTTEHSVESVVETLVEADLQANQVKGPTAVEDHPQTDHNDLVVEIDHPEGGEFKTTGTPVRLSETPDGVQRRPPRFGEHTREVLGEVGYDDGTIDDLVASGAVQAE
jgi:crotonobetainyl-CoA:carnitine CoA-transferase CaiB-like acyl-CoA transferase